MKKLYLLLDEWKNDRNFVGSELEVIKQHFDVTVICNDFDDKASCQFPENVRFYFYRRKAGIWAILYGLKFFLDKDLYAELKNLKTEDNKFAKFSEIIRFYINGELFHKYLGDHDFISESSDAIYYSYWYFWKCFGVVKHRDKYPGIKAITRVHGYDLYKDQIPTNYQAFKEVMDKKLDRIVFISEHGFEYYLNSFGINKLSKHLLYKLGTTNTFGLNTNSIDDSVIRIVSCSSVIELKRVELIANALSTINHQKISWVHFGNGLLYEDLKNKAKRLLDAKENIEYSFPGYVVNSEIMNYYSKNHVDAFLMVSRSEGNPVSVIEAMSFGIPVISTSITNMPNLIKGNGILISENPSPEELAEAIKKLPFGDSIREQSRKLWEQEYQSEINNQRFVEEVLLQL